MAKRMSLKARVVKALEAAPDCFPDKFVNHPKAETVDVKRYFFYRHGQTAETWAKQVALALEGSGLAVTDSREDYRQWPTSSYFVAVVAEVCPFCYNPNVTVRDIRRLGKCRSCGYTADTVL